MPMLSEAEKKKERIKKWLEGMSPAELAQLQYAMVPRLPQPYCKHIPHPKQQVFLSLQEEEAMYGGSAGGGKSDALLTAALQYVDVPGYSALILRRTWPDLNASGAILDRCRQWLSGTPVRERDGGRLWVFPSGARLSFGYLQHENDKLKFQSAEYQFIGVDELTQFPQSQYTYIQSRLRKPQITCLSCRTPVRLYGKQYKHTEREAQRECKTIFPDPAVVQQYQPGADGTSLWDVPLRVRSATNPGGPGHEWVYDYFINPETRNPDTVFIRASLLDNPSLDRVAYEKTLSKLLPIDRERLLNGDWEIVAQGNMFDRHNFRTVEGLPAGRPYQQVVRYWDMAGTENAGDYTASALLFLIDGSWYLFDVTRHQVAGANVDKLLKQVSDWDKSMPWGRHIRHVMEQEPGSAGKTIIHHFRTGPFVGKVLKEDRPTGSKTTRATPWANQVNNEVPNFFLVKARWNKDLIDQAELFPEGENDDMVDAVSGAYNYISETPTTRLIA